MEQVYQRFKQVRKKLGLTQSEMSAKTGIFQKDISRLENGKLKFVNNNYLIKLYELGINLNWIYTGNGAMFVENITHSHEDINNQFIRQKEKLFELDTENKLLKNHIKELKKEKKLLLQTFTALKDGNLFR